MVKLKDIFDLWYGVNLEVVNSTVVEKGIPFVSRQSVNNGVVCYVAPIEGIKPNPANTLSIAVSGSVLSTFYHDYEYYSGRDVYVAKPKEPMTKEEMLYYAYIIEQNKYRYNYGRGANRTFKDILVPTKNEIPSYIKEIKIPSIKNEIIYKDNIKLNTNDWKWFYIKDLFDVKAGKYHYKKEYEEGNTPYLSATSANNGVGERISLAPEFEGGTLTTEKVKCTSFYLPIRFCATSDVNIILRKDGKPINQYVGLFIASIIDFNESFRWTYGRQCRVNDTKKIRIKLPTTLLGEPDWQFMEDYIKSLPYSKNLEPIDPNEQIRALKKKLEITEHQLHAQQSGQIVNYGTINFNDNSKNFRIE